MTEVRMIMIKAERQCNLHTTTGTTISISNTNTYTITSIKNNIMLVTA